MARQFGVVDEREETQLEKGSDTAHAGPTAAQVQQQQAAAQMFALALKALSQRTMVALSSLFTAGALFSVFWLFDACLPEPTQLQLTGCTLYGVFVLLLEFVRRR